MGGANWAILRTHVRVVGWLCRRYPDRNLGLDAIRPINWAKALGLSYSVADDVIERLVRWPPQFVSHHSNR